MAIEKIKTQEADLELPAKKHCEFSLFSMKMGQMGWIGIVVYLVAPKQPQDFDFFQWPWVLIIHLSLFPLRTYAPKLFDIINFS